MTSALAAILAIAVHVHEGDVQAIASILDQGGTPIADGRYVQTIDSNRLHIDSRYDFADGRVVEEKAVLQLQPSLRQRSWEWEERDASGTVLRRYTVDFDTGHATMEKSKGDKADEHLEIHPGKTFGGIGFIIAIKNLRADLAPGKSIDLEAAAFTPGPRTAGVELRHEQPGQVTVADRTLAADAWTIHPKVPAIAKLFVHVPDQHVWLFASDPAALLRFEGPLIEKDDPIIRIETIPSAPANVRRGRTATPRKDRSRAARAPARP